MTTSFRFLFVFDRNSSVKLNLLLGLIIGCYLVAPKASHAGLTFVGNAYAILSANGGANTSYAVDAYNNPTFSGSLASIVLGQTLKLGGEVQTYPGNLATDYASSAHIGYIIKNSGGTQLSASEIGMAFLDHAGTGNNGSNDRWRVLPSSVDIASGLGAGTYTLQVYFYGTSSAGGDLYDSNSGNNYSASFTVTPVPEPITLALPIFGGLVLTTGLVRRFISRKAAPPA